MSEAKSETPDVIGTVRGYRVFQLQWSGRSGFDFDRLCSTTRGYHWQDGVNNAQCFDCPPRQFPRMSHSCGLYSTSDPDSPALPGHYPGATHVLGVVESHGPIVQHEQHGVMRARHSRIVAVAVENRNARLLRVHYPSVQFFTSEEAMLRAFPPSGPPLITKREAAASRLRRWWCRR